MRNIKFFILCLTTLLFNFCSNDKSNIAVNEIDFNSISIQEKSVKEFIPDGYIKKLVKLDTIDKSLIGNIDLVRIDGYDILVGDFYPVKKVHRFDKTGKYISSYGKLGRGPGEYVGIKGFDILSDGSIVFLTDLKLIKYAKSGELIKEIRTNFVPKDIAVIGDLIYISHLGFRMSPMTNEAILIYNNDLEKIGGLLDFDNRLENYKYIPTNSFSRSRNILYFIDFYNLKVFKYNPKMQAVVYLEFPSNNSDLNAIWGKKFLTENDYRELKKRLHRFNFIYGSKDDLLLLAYCAKKRIFDYWILNLEKRTAKVFKYSADYFKNNLFFTRFAGSYEGGVIGVFNDNESFNKYKMNYPVMKDIEFSIEDNPILVFFEFHKPLKSQGKT